MLSFCLCVHLYFKNSIRNHKLCHFFKTWINIFSSFLPIFFFLISLNFSEIFPFTGPNDSFLPNDRQSGKACPHPTPFAYTTGAACPMQLSEHFTDVQPWSPYNTARHFKTTESEINNIKKVYTGHCMWEQIVLIFEKHWLTMTTFFRCQRSGC